MNEPSYTKKQLQAILTAAFERANRRAGRKPASGYTRTQLITIGSVAIAIQEHEAEQLASNQTNQPRPLVGHSQR